MSLENIIKAPFGYPGNKRLSLTNLLPILQEPPHTRFIDVFGGSGVVSFNKEPVDMNVYNDAYSGLTDFYICLRNPPLYNELCDKLEEIPYGIEFWEYCAHTWAAENDRVERAARWYFMTKMSFATLGRHVGKAFSGSQPRRWRNKFDDLYPVHEALKRIIIENKRWLELMEYYDSEDTLFYCDPPYLDTDNRTYKPRGSEDLFWSRADHEIFLQEVFKFEGCVMVSSYYNDLYVNQPWDDVHEWDVRLLMGTANVEDFQHSDRKIVKEMLFVKDFNYAR